jgi:hypothetical protein
LADDGHNLPPFRERLFSTPANGKEHRAAIPDLWPRRLHGFGENVTRGIEKVQMHYRADGLLWARDCAWLDDRQAFERTDDLSHERRVANRALKRDLSIRRASLARGNFDAVYPCWNALGG